MLVVGLVSVLVLVTSAGVALAAVTVARHRAAAAADLAALAAASPTSSMAPAPAAGCEAAGRVARAQGGLLLGCVIRADGTVDVTAAAPLPGWVGRVAAGGAPVRARARAGTLSP